MCITHHHQREVHALYTINPCIHRRFVLTATTLLLFRAVHPQTHGATNVFEVQDGNLREETILSTRAKT